MAKPKFKVGDKVKVLDGSKIEDYVGSWSIAAGMHSYIGDIRTISKIDTTNYNGRIGYFLDGSYFVWDERGLAPITMPTKIVVTTDGKTTSATLYDGKTKVNTAIAKCCPDDTFDFTIGARLAINKLLGVGKNYSYTATANYVNRNNSNVICSKCGKAVAKTHLFDGKVVFNLTPYCGNCGRKMINYNEFFKEED